MEELLCDAALRGDIESLHEIISRDSFILYKVCVGSFKGKNPLHVAVSIGQREFVLKLLEIKSDLAEVLDTELGAALHVASSKGYIEIVKDLVKVSPKMCLARDRDGNNPLHIAAIKGQVQVLKELVRTSPHRSARAKVDQGDTILHLCVMYNQFNCLKLMVDMIPDPDFVNDADSDGNTILHLAVFEKQLKMIKHVLTNSKIDVNAINKSGRTALDVHFLAVGNPTDSEIQDILLEAGAKRREHAEVDQQFEPSWRAQRRDTFMVVASLIATMAFQVGLNPPGGVWQDHDSQGQITGKSVLAHADGSLFYRLMIANTIVFLVSLSTIVLLIFSMPEPKRVYRWTRAMITWSTIIVTGSTYTFSITAITPAKFHDGTGADETFVAATLLWIAVMTVSTVRSTFSTRKSQNVGHGKGSILKAGRGGRPRSGANGYGGNHQSNV
ncbi:ankyrin repeat-containing protein BDA1-like [Rhododendron vialii]|uniref:ankyrin repeat-containing protein BDA1-like n=1 Tax=Rhododendron vialii TaxID=182163 RepID=UPI0026600114|nr:ankyrin repeat-containing protein BDA1-like [Rhododendron vialii]